MVSKFKIPSSDVSVRRVLQKIYALKAIDKADFVNTRWLFDWSVDKAPVDNVPIATGELEALKNLELEGVIALIVEVNEAHINTFDFDSPPKTRFRGVKDYQISQHKVYKPEKDTAYLGFDWCAWITALDYEKFLIACKNNGFEPSTGVTEGVLSLESLNIPVVTTNGISYRMKPLKSGKAPEEIINYCLTDKPNKIVTVDELIAAGVIERRANLKQVFGKTQFGSKSAAIKPFVTIQPDSIRVLQKAMLNPEQQSKIITVSNNF